VADKSRLLFKLMSPKASCEEIGKSLEAYGVYLQNKYMAVICIETEGNYFEHCYEEFLSVLEKEIPMGYEYINQYPNLASILIYSGNRMEQEEIERAAEKIYRAMTGMGNGKASMIVGRRCFGWKDFGKNMQEIERLREDTFSCFSGVIYTGKVHRGKEERLTQTERMKQEVLASIRNRDLTAVKEQMAAYLSCLKDEKSSSAMYAKYTFLDIVKALYEEYGIYHKGILFETTEEIM